LGFILAFAGAAFLPAGFAVLRDAFMGP
jgi:hypothetical protein